MSRDWTPREMYEVEKYNIQHGLGSWWDHMENSVWVINGETFPMCTPETIARRKEFPCLGRLFEQYDRLYASLSQFPGGLDLLARHEKELSEYIETGAGDKESFLIRWFEGRLDEGFYYRERNDALLLASIQDEVADIFRFDPQQENCVWFPLSGDKCISVWLWPDVQQGDQLLMKLEERLPDGSMGPGCPLIFDESYGTGNLSEKAISRTLQEIYEDAGLECGALDTVDGLTNKVMSMFKLKKKTLEEQIRNASERTSGSGREERQPAKDMCSDR